MSRHYFETTYKDHPVTVLLGWDRALGHYFLVIEKQVDFVDPDVTGFDDQYRGAKLILILSVDCLKMPRIRIKA